LLFTRRQQRRLFVRGETMSAIQHTNTANPAKLASPARARHSLTTRFIDLLSSVRFGVVLLVLLGVACMLGMLIMQQSVEGFEKYYAELTPSQRLVYGGLGFFDIYHTWYFNFLLFTLSLNIVLASIDRLPGTWRYVSRKKLDATRAYVLGQKQNAALSVEAADRAGAAERVRSACRSIGLKARLSEKGDRTCVFAERGAWNRLGAYAVHAALLVVFLGFFLTAQYAQTGQMPLQPGETTDEMTKLDFNLDRVSNVTMRLPFTITCTDVQQKLIKPEGGLSPMNTLDWLTRVRVKDETGEHEGLVHLNAPFDYRGYRFFQSSFVSPGHARSITLRLTPEAGGEAQSVTVERNGSATLPDGTQIAYLNFYPDFVMDQNGPATASDDYNRPAAQLAVTTPAGQRKVVYAYAVELENADDAPFGGYEFKLMDFEKAATAHILAVQHDPGRYPFYLGGALLALSLGAVFFCSHQRVWAVVEENAEGRYDVTLGGNASRNQTAFEDRFQRLVEAIGRESNNEVDHE
jgi:cytochrome c biogenesis protein